MQLESKNGLTVAELIDALSEHPADAIVEMAIIAPVQPDDEDITVDRYHIDGLLPWSDEDSDDDDPGTVWVVGGDDNDVDTFLDAIEQNVDPSGDQGDHDHDH